MRSQLKKQRHKQLAKLLENDPLRTDDSLAKALSVSVGTIRLDRAELGYPELRERMRTMAERAQSQLTSLKQEEVVGELLELEPNSWGLSMLATTREMAFRHTDLVADLYTYAQAATLAIAVIGEEMVVVGSSRLNWIRPAFVGERLVARAKVGTRKENKYVVSVRTRVDDREIFVARFIVANVPFDRYKNRKASHAPGA